MKTRNLLTVVCIAICSNAFAQNKTVVAAEKMNILYRGIENPVAIAVSGVNADKIQISVNGGTYTKNSDVNYNIVPTGNSKQVNISVFSVNGKDTAYYGSSAFRVKQIPEPNLFLAGVNLSEKDPAINRNMLKTSPFIFFKLENFEFEVPASTVISFELSYKVDSNIISESINGNRLPEGILQKILKLPLETNIIINNIKIKNADGTIRAAGGSIFKLM